MFLQIPQWKLRADFFSATAQLPTLRPLVVVLAVLQLEVATAAGSAVVLLAVTVQRPATSAEGQTTLHAIAKLRP